MTSPTPLLYNTCYHIHNRGINRENIFVEERNYAHFMNLYARYIEPIADTFAYCLLRNHFHVLIRTKPKEEVVANRETLKVSAGDHGFAGKGDRTNRVARRPGKPLGSDYISRQFSDFFNAYAKAINKAYGRTGSLFQHPFGRVPITNERQFWNVIAYIHQNPQKHKFVKDFREWKYSSYGIIPTGQRTIVNRLEVMKWFGDRQGYFSLHDQWVTDAQSRWFAQDDDD